MKQPEKNSIVAQASTEQNYETAFKIIGSSSAAEKLEDDTKHGDFDGDYSSVLQYTIEVGMNGFFVTISFNDDDAPDSRYVADTMDDVVKILKGKF